MPGYAGAGQPGLAQAARVHDVLPGLLRDVLAVLRSVALTQLQKTNAVYVQQHFIFIYFLNFFSPLLGFNSIFNYSIHFNNT